MDSGNGVSRRTILRQAGASAAAGGLVGFAGCTSGDGNGDGDGGGGNGGGSTGGSLTVGFLYPTSGPYSALGEYQVGGTEVALGRVAAEMDVEIDNVGIFDTKLDPQEGLRRAKELTDQEDVDVLVGTNSSAVAAAVADHAARTETPLIITGAAAEALTGENCNEYTFRTIGNTYQNTKALAEFAMEELGSRFATMGADYSWGRASAGAFTEVARNNGGEVVEQVWPKLGATDYSSQIQKISDSGADLVSVRLAGSDAVNATKQMASFGLKEEMDVLILNSVDVVKGAGPAAVGTYGAGYYFETDTEANRQFVENYMDENDGAVPDTWAMTAYNATLLAAQAAAETGSSADGTALAGALEGMSVQGPTGESTLRECDHQATAPIAVSETVESRDGWWGKKEFPSREVLAVSDTGTNVRPCEESGCDLSG